MEEKAHVNKMGVMPVKKLLIEMAWPAVLSMTINALYNIVDSIFVAKISEDALTAVSIVNPIQMLIIALSVGSGVGINSLIARKLGAKKQEEADQAASTGLRIGLLNYVVFLIIGVCFTGIFVSGYAEKGTYIYEEAVKYMAIVCIGSFFLNMQVVLEKILQATGNMIGPMVCSLTGAVVNIILDPILIFGLLGAPKLGVAGAAIATVIGQVCGMTMGAFITFKGDHLVKLTVKGFKIDWKIAADIYKVGLPSIVMQSIASVMIIFYNKILVDFSTTAVAVCILQDSVVCVHAGVWFESRGNADYGIQLRRKGQIKTYAGIQGSSENCSHRHGTRRGAFPAFPEGTSAYVRGFG